MEASSETAARPLASGDRVELRIDSLAAGGDGVGRAADGRVVFVPLTAPGDRVRARVVSVRARFARAELEQVLAPGPSRIAPRCPVFGECGGCSWQHVDYATQCEAKRLVVEDALRRIGHLAPPELRWVPSPDPFAYRARARVLVEHGRVGYRRRHSRELCAVERCPVLTAPVEAALATLADDPRAGDGEWEIAEGVLGVAAHPSSGPGAPTELAVDGLPLRVSPGVFHQAHAGLRGALLQEVARVAGEGALALELFAGAGFFTLRLARAFEEVVAVEAQPEAVADLRHNLARAGRGNVRVVAHRVEAALARRDLLAARPDAVVLDPPRAGLAAGVVERLCGLSARRIAYLSCDPATLARDLAPLVAGGYLLEEVLAFDLFPQTPHVEVLAALRAA